MHTFFLFVLMFAFLLHLHTHGNSFVLFSSMSCRMMTVWVSGSDQQIKGHTGGQKFGSSATSNKAIPNMTVSGNMVFWVGVRVVSWNVGGFSHSIKHNKVFLHLNKLKGVVVYFRETLIEIGS